MKFLQSFILYVRPAGDTRGAGIGTPEAIKMVWSCHREIVHDTIIPDNWAKPRPS
jgi:1-pyrroline-5-carboxylate dehydrogenase